MLSTTFSSLWTFVTLAILFRNILVDVDALVEGDVDADCRSAEVAVDAVFAVDTSSSVRREEFTQAVTFVAKFVDYLGAVSVLCAVGVRQVYGDVGCTCAVSVLWVCCKCMVTWAVCVL